jgi:hypothetical protein
LAVAHQQGHIVSRLKNCRSEQILRLFDRTAKRFVNFCHSNWFGPNIKPTVFAGRCPSAGPIVPILLPIPSLRAVK